MDRLLSEEELTEHIKACFENGRPMYRPTLDEVLEMIEALAPAEPTSEQIEEYCRRRCLTILSNEFYAAMMRIVDMKPAWPLDKPKIIRCKECKYFEYDSVAKVGGIPLIVAHEICNKWGDGCKTSEDGWCFLAEQKESENERMVES